MGLFHSASGGIRTVDEVDTLERISTDDTPVELTTDGAAPTSSNVLVLEDNETILYDIGVVAARTDIFGESAAYKILVCLERATGEASTALVGSSALTILAEDDTDWDVSVEANIADGALRILVTGEAGKTIQWVAKVLKTESLA